MRSSKFKGHLLVIMFCHLGAVLGPNILDEEDTGEDMPFNNNHFGRGSSWFWSRQALECCGTTLHTRHVPLQSLSEQNAHLKSGSCAKVMSSLSGSATYLQCERGQWRSAAFFPETTNIINSFIINMSAPIMKSDL